jgi:hypothetical protein
VPSLNANSSGTLALTSNLPGLASNTYNYTLRVFFRLLGLADQPVMTIDDAGSNYWQWWTTAAGALEIDSNTGNTALLTGLSTSEWIGIISRIDASTSRTCTRRGLAKPVFTNATDVLAASGIWLAGSGFSEHCNVVVRGWAIWDSQLTDAEMIAELQQLEPVKRATLFHYEDCGGVIAAAGRDVSGRGRNFTRAGTWIVSQWEPPVPPNRDSTQRILDAAANAYTLTAASKGIDLAERSAGLTAQRQLAAASKSIDLAEQSAVLNYGFTLPASSAALNLAERDAGLTAQRTLAAASKSINLAEQAASLSGAFPLVASASGRFLQDQNGVPFRIQSESAWLMSIYGTSSSVDSYLDDRLAKGFNTFILMPIVTSDFGGPNNANGDAPFSTAGHFSTTNNAYWNFIDTIMTKALARNMVVKFAMVYLGFGGGSQGWASEITQSYNADPVMFNYGVFLATRYASFPNVIWYTCGDYGPPTGGTLSLRVQKVRDGILSVLPDAIFGAEMDNPDTMPGDYTDFSNLDCNTAYGYGPSGRPDQTYDTADRSWGYGKPAWIGEPAYEDTAFGTDPSREGIRASQWWSITGGMVAGCSMGTKGIWDFGLSASVASRLETDVCHDTVYQNDFWSALKWYLHVPSGKTEISSRTLCSQPSANNYEHVQASMASDGSSLVAYVPPNGTGTVTFTVDLRGMAAGTLRARWYNPTDGTYSTTGLTGTFDNTQNAKSVTTPGDNGTAQGDWALLVDVPPAANAYTLTAASKSIDLAERSAGLTAQRLLTAGSAASNLAEQPAGLTAQRVLAAVAASLNMAEQAAGLTAQRVLSAASKSLDLAANDAALLYGLQLVAASKGIDLSANDVALLRALVLSVDSKALDLAGRDAALTYSSLRTLVASAASLNLTERDAGLLRTLLLAIDSKAIDLSALPATLAWSSLVTSVGAVRASRSSSRSVQVSGDHRPRSVALKRRPTYATSTRAQHTRVSGVPVPDYAVFGALPAHRAVWCPYERLTGYAGPLARATDLVDGRQTSVTAPSGNGSQADLDAIIAFGGAHAVGVSLLYDQSGYSYSVPSLGNDLMSGGSVASPSYPGPPVYPGYQGIDPGAMPRIYDPAQGGISAANGKPSLRCTGNTNTIQATGTCFRRGPCYGYPPEPWDPANNLGFTGNPAITLWWVGQWVDDGLGNGSARYLMELGEFFGPSLLGGLGLSVQEPGLNRLWITGGPDNPSPPFSRHLKFNLTVPYGTMQHYVVRRAAGARWDQTQLWQNGVLQTNVVAGSGNTAEQLLLQPSPFGAIALMCSSYEQQYANGFLRAAGVCAQALTDDQLTTYLFPNLNRLAGLP